MSEDLIWFFKDLCQYTLNGLAQGSIYALIALGYTMVYGIIKLINFAHGEFYMIGAFIGFACISAGFPLWIAMPLAMIGSGLVAALVERLVYRPIRNAGRITALITALGVSLFFQYSGQLTIGAEPKAFPSVIENTTYDLGDVYIETNMIIIMVLTALLMVFLYWLVGHTKVGKAMRATSFDVGTAELMGINSNRIISFTFFIGAAFAGAAGVLVGMYYNTIDPLMGMIPGIKAFVAAVLGGIGIIPGAVVGGLVLGLAENLVTGFWVSTYRDAIAFGILILILVIRPSGLLGKNTKEKV